MDEVPSTSLVSENVFNSVDGTSSVLNRLYQGYVDNFYGGTAFSFDLEGTSIFRGSKTTAPSDYWFQHATWSTTSNNAGEYKIIYNLIGMLNQFISGVSKGSLDEETKLEFIGEARLIRAYFFFLAVRLWGDVPLPLEETASLAQANLPRTKYTEVYKAILDDLDFAEQYVNTKDVQDALYPNYDRSCNFAATALKAKVYVQIACLMENKDDNFFDLTKNADRYPDFSSCGIPVDDVKKAWTLALEAAEKTINEGPFALEPDFRHLFRYDPENYPEDYDSKERIIMGTVSPKMSVYYVAWAAPNYYAMDRASNGNNRRIVPARWNWEEWCKRYGGTLKTGHQDAIGDYHWYSGCPDPRLDVTYLHDTYITATSATNDSPTTCYAYPYWTSETTKNTNFVAGWSESVGSSWQSGNLLYKKRLSPRYAGAGKGGDADIYVLRLADVYLLAAEAAASLGNRQKAIDYVNVILERARKSVDDPTKPAAQPAAWNIDDEKINTQEKLINEIMWERVFELDGEMHIWFDSHRRGATYLSNLTKERNQFYSEPANVRIYKYYELGKPRVTDVQEVRKGLLHAFPEYELLNNTSLGYDAQNDFYNK